jgi:uncharacterized protein (DUF58 family)
MLDRRWIAALALLALLAIWFEHALLSFCTSLCLLLSLSLLVWRRFSLVGVSYRRRLSCARAQFGEIVELATEVVNLKLLPVPLLEIEDQLPRHLTVEGASIRAGRDQLLPSLFVVRSMLPYERVTTRLRVPCLRRGDHEFGPARWRSGDYLGLRASYESANETDRLLVLPKVFPLAMHSALASELLGARSARRRLFTDPLRIAGRRDYASGDPLRLIDWRATARRDVLTVRQFESSTAANLLIAINFRIHAPTGDRYAPDELEFAICIAASLAEHGSEHGWRTGLLGNGTAAGAGIRLPPSSAPAQRALILETLARANTIPNESLAQLLHRHVRSAYERSSLVLITTEPDAALSEVLVDLHRRGHAITMIYIARTDEQIAPSLAGIPVLRAQYDREWMSHEALVLAG